MSSLLPGGSEGGYFVSVFTWKFMEENVFVTFAMNFVFCKIPQVCTYYVCVCVCVCVCCYP